MNNVYRTTEKGRETGDFSRRISGVRLAREVDIRREGEFRVARGAIEEGRELGFEGKGEGAEAPEVQARRPRSRSLAGLRLLLLAGLGRFENQGISPSDEGERRPFRSLKGQGSGGAERDGGPDGTENETLARAPDPDEGLAPARIDRLGGV